MSVGLNYVVVSQEACGMVACCELNKTVDEVANSILSPPLCRDRCARMWKPGPSTE